MTDNLIERLELIDRLELIIRQWDTDVQYAHYIGERTDQWTDIDIPIDDVREAAQALKAKDAEIERLKEALKPFADWPVLEAYNDDNYVDCAFQTGHFRAARKALGGRDGE